MDRSVSPHSVMTEATEYFDAEDDELGRTHDGSDDERSSTPTPTSVDAATVGQELTSDAISQLQAGFDHPSHGFASGRQGEYDTVMSSLQGASAKATSSNTMAEIDLNETPNSTLFNDSARYDQSTPTNTDRAPAPVTPSQVSGRSAEPSSPAASLPPPPQSPKPTPPKKRSAMLKYLDSFSSWTSTAMLRVEQSLLERFNGREVPSEDEDIEARHDQLSATQASYEELVRLVTLMSTHYRALIKLNSQLAAHTGQLAVRRPAINGPAETLTSGFQTLQKTSAYLLGSVDFFLDNMSTMVNAAFQDAEDSYQSFVLARLKRDAALRQMSMLVTQKTSKREQERAAKRAALEKQVEHAKATFFAKLELLEMHEVKTAEKQLSLLAAAIEASIGGDQERLQSILDESAAVIKTVQRNGDTPRGGFDSILDGVHSILAGSLAPETGEL
eukprot:TRINITY_DN8705_c0_g1_i1.p2 TRINITY_DN8705_c0_g1~~TRINITY_DN8705_c0_g1_i1.p2  ORF type:complete len:453 (+),score=105.49 TRINITY_DN8705_c0_g1_i1:27-1361(+)